MYLNRHLLDHLLLLLHRLLRHPLRTRRPSRQRVFAVTAARGAAAAVRAAVGAAAAAGAHTPAVAAVLPLLSPAAVADQPMASCTGEVPPRPHLHPAQRQHNLKLTLHPRQKAVDCQCWAKQLLPVLVL